MNRTTVSIILLFMLIMALNLPSWLEDEQRVPTTVKEEAWQPNYQARTMRSTLFDSQGLINHEVYAHKMEHYELLGFTLFEKPKYTIYTRNSQQPWQVDAEEGTLYENNRIQLEKNISIQSQDEQGFVQTIHTSFLEIDLQQKTMMSDQPVTISGKDYVIQSNGFSANLETQQFELLNHVQTIYGQNIHQ